MRELRGPDELEAPEDQAGEKASLAFDVRDNREATTNAEEVDAPADLERTQG